jgi:carbon catabolite-derepressing protein kinase
MYYQKPSVDDKYLIESSIGNGGSSIVFKAISEQGLSALKIVRKDKQLTCKIKQDIVTRECDILNYLGFHPNITFIKDSNCHGYSISRTHTTPICYISFEFCQNGSLFDLISKSGPLDIDVAKFYMVQLCSAIKHLHDNNISHSDIKPGNILLDELFNLKLSDFGCSQYLNDDGKTTQRLGTNGYIAPEIRHNSSYNAYASDVYA